MHLDVCDGALRLENWVHHVSVNVPVYDDMRPAVVVGHAIVSSAVPSVIIVLISSEVVRIMLLV